MKRAIIAVMVALAAASCTKEIEFKGELKENLLVAYAEIEEGKPLNLSLSTTAPAFGAASLNRTKEYWTGIHDSRATIKAFIGNEEYTLKSYRDSIYLCDHCPKMGDEVRYEISYPGYAPVTGGAVVPERVDAELLTAVLDLQNNEWEIKFRIHDKAGTNYYRVQAYDRFIGERIFFYYDDDWNLTDEKLESFALNESKWMNSSDPVFGSTQAATAVIEELFGDEVDISGYFSDELFDGKDYDITIRCPGWAFNYEEERSVPDEDGQWFKCTPYISIQALSRELYLYGASYWAFRTTGSDSIFGESVQIISNVAGGTGCIGALSSTPIALPL